MSAGEQDLSARIEQLENELREATETLDAIRNGEVDAVVVGGPHGQIVYALENADRPYRVLVEEMIEGALTLDAEGIVLYANRSFSTMVERPFEALVGASLLDHVGDPLRLRGMLENQAGSAELTLRARSGRRIPVNLSIVELKVDGDAPRMLCGIVTDLSENYARAGELTQAHARLAERTRELEISEARLRAVFDTSYQFQALLDPQGLLVDANSVSLRAIRAGLADVAGLAYWQTPWFATTPGMAETIKAAIDAVSAGGMVRTEFEINLPEGGWRSFAFSLRAIRNAEGAVLAIVPEAVDLTDMRRAESALRQSQKLEAIGQLTGGVAHDFNNLLTVIRGSVELLRRPGLTEDKYQRYTAAIAETADRATRLTSQLLAFARRQALQPEPFDVGASLENVKGIVTSLTGSRIVLETRLPPTACFVLADRSQFDTAIVNMAINARDAMDGEGRITITVAPASAIPAVRGQPAMAGDFMAIAISDTGHGIVEDDFTRIFEPFYTTKGVGAGTGLGLSQVIGFAKQSEGEICVESVRGKGTVFTLYLPRIRPAADDQAGATPLEAVAGGGARVLVVEDNENVGAFAAAALKDLGFDSVLALDAGQALRQLETDSDTFDVVFSDVVIPGTSGLELAKIVQTRYPGIPVILASGYSHVLAESGSHGFPLLQKPYSLEELSRIIGAALASRGPASAGSPPGAGAQRSRRSSGGVHFRGDA